MRCGWICRSRWFTGRWSTRNGGRSLRPIRFCVTCVWVPIAPRAPPAPMLAIWRAICGGAGTAGVTCPLAPGSCGCSSRCSGPRRWIGPARGGAGPAARAGSTTCWRWCVSSINTPWPTVRWTPRCWPRCTRSATTGTCPRSCDQRVPGCVTGLDRATSSAPAALARPVPVRRDEAQALLRAAASWRDRFLLVLLWFCGLRVGEALGLRRSDLHLVPTAAAQGCAVPGPHLHVVGRDNPNRARAKSGDRAVPVRAEVLSCYDRYLCEREAYPAAADCDFVLVALRRNPIGRPMSTDTVRKWLAALSRRAELDRVLHPHLFRHATATELFARGAAIDVVKELLGHASIRATEAYLHPD